MAEENKFHGNVITEVTQCGELFVAKLKLPMSLADGFATVTVTGVGERYIHAEVKYLPTQKARYQNMSPSDMLKEMGDDASKWAAAFCELAANKGIEVEEGWMLSWFANAIEHSSAVRRWAQEAQRPKPTVEELDAILNDPTPYDVHVNTDGSVTARPAPPPPETLGA